METKLLRKLPEEKLIELLQKNEITLAQYFQVSIETKEEYKQHAKLSGMHMDDVECAKGFSLIREKALEEGMKTDCA